MKKAEKALKASVWAVSCECVRTEYAGRDLSILDLLPPGVSKGGRWNVWRGDWASIRKNDGHWR